MAMVFLGKSTCPICGKLLQEGEEIISLPAIGDLTNPLYPYFDAGLHRSCFENWEKRDEIETILKRISN